MTTPYLIRMGNCVIGELGLGGWLLLTTVALDLLVLVALVGVSLYRRFDKRRSSLIRVFMRTRFAGATTDQVARVVQRNPDEFLREFMDLSDNVQLPGEQIDKARIAIARAHQFPRMLRQLSSPRPYLRKRAATWLSYATTDQAARPMVIALEKERDCSVRLHLVHALSRLGDPAVIPTIVDSLSGTDLDYQRRVLGCLRSFGDDFTFYFDILKNRKEAEIERLVAEMAAIIDDERGRLFLESKVQSSDLEIRRHAARLLLSKYASTTDIESLLQHEDLLVVNLALEAMGSTYREEYLETLLDHIQQPETRKSSVVALSAMVRTIPRLYQRVLTILHDSENEAMTEPLIAVVGQRVEYLLERYLRSRDPSAESAIIRLLRGGRSSGIIAFLNRNEDPRTESTIAELMSPVVSGSTELSQELAVYAKDSLLLRLGLERNEIEERKGERVGEATRPIAVLALIVAVVFVPPVVFLICRWIGTDSAPSFRWFFTYIAGFEAFFGGYAFTLNMIYLGLLAAASRAVRKQQANLSIKPLSMLFRPGMLPSVSIIVPAYREESTIVENVNSLMNLRYPDVEVIVVNDGSPDDTLAALIDSFELERTDIFVHGYLETQPIRGIYRNPRIPELIVIDKHNGGKADSLNAGINAARNNYFAAIDSDSLLERDSLIRLCANFLDSDVPVVASGGNVFPVNGCRVDQGCLDSVGLPKQLLARYQVLEYLRSFAAGRTGWAHLKSLMIISGAFGLFQKREVVNAHGYLTGRGHYSKDTVAEDMELVVRIARSLRDSRRPFAVQYAYNANCWTEIPTTRRILRSQRDRWQRGLIDTMFFHIGMLLNPRYGPIGLVGFPYYFIFELIGPWIEVQGLLFFVVGLAAGRLPLAIAGLVFAATVPMGVAVSLSSLLLAEYHQRYFGPIDRFRLLILAVVENVGYRQYASLLRLSGYISAMKRTTGWGVMMRAGFSRGGSDRGLSADGDAIRPPSSTGNGSTDSVAR